MDDGAAIGPRRRDEWRGINSLQGVMEGIRSKGLIPDESARTTVEHYSARRDDLERAGRLSEALANARELTGLNPTQALNWATRAREFGPDRPEGRASGIALHRRRGRH